MKASNDLQMRAWKGLIGFLMTLALLIFAAAGRINYWQGWLYWLAFSCAVVAITLYLMKYDRALLERRMEAGAGAEKEKSQKIIQGIMSLVFIALYIISGLDYRFGWSRVAPIVSVFADGVAVAGFYIVFETFKINTFTSAIIGTDKKQKVISSGVYGVVRHPMYAGALLMICATPLALGSWWGLIVAVLMMAGIIVRLLDEEKYLSKNLEGYKEYLKKTKYRLIPFIY